jgi:hypothetical protein
LLSELTKSFLILRDIFGYALPGAVFLAIGVLCRRFSLHDVQNFLAPYQIPAWLALVLALGACYTTGHAMAQVAYFTKNWKYFWEKRKKARAGGKATSPAKTEYTGHDPDLIELRESHPAMLNEFERQSTISQFRGGTAAAMLSGSVIFYVIRVPLPIGLLVGIAGAFQLLEFWLCGLDQIQDVIRDTIKAGQNAKKQDSTQQESNADGH